MGTGSDSNLVIFLTFVHVDLASLVVSAGQYLQQGSVWQTHWPPLPTFFSKFSPPSWSGLGQTIRFSSSQEVRIPPDQLKRLRKSWLFSPQTELTPRTLFQTPLWPHCSRRPREHWLSLKLELGKKLGRRRVCQIFHTSSWLMLGVQPLRSK